jgi:hypothetical protein
MRVRWKDRDYAISRVATRSSCITCFLEEPVDLAAGHTPFQRNGLRTFQAYAGQQLHRANPVAWKQAHLAMLVRLGKGA